MHIFKINDNISLAKTLAFTALFLCEATNLNASPLYYSFEGTISSFSSFNDAVDLSDYNVELGQTAVSYVYQVDFDRNTRTFTNTAGTWNYFYSDLLSGGIVNGENPEDNESYNVHFFSHTDQGHMQGGSRVEVLTSDAATTSWKVEDWSIGQQLRLIDGGYLSTGSGGAVYFFGDVELTSISTANPVPVPGTLPLLVSVLCGVRMVCRRG